MLSQQQQHQHQEDASHSRIASTLPPFISTIYGPAGLLAFPAPHRPFPFDFHLVSGRHHHHHQHPAIPIDLSVGSSSSAERRHASPLLLHLDDARVPTRNASRDPAPSPLPLPTEAAALDLSCGRKRKATPAPAEPVKPPKLFKPYLLDEDNEEEEEEELKVVDDDDEEDGGQTEETESSTASLKGDSFLDQDLAGLKDRLGHRLEYSAAAAAAWHHHQQQQQYYPGSSPGYDNYYYGHENNLTLYPSPARRYESSQSSLSPSAASSPLHQPSRPSSEAGFGSPASSEVRASPPAFSLDLKLQSLHSAAGGWPEVRPVLGAVF